jgi:hypothetical protein
MYVPSNIPIAGPVSNLNVMGRTSASAIEKVSPGMEPKTMPMIDPTTIASNVKGSEIPTRALYNASIADP